MTNQPQENKGPAAPITAMEPEGNELDFHMPASEQPPPPAQEEPPPPAQEEPPPPALEEVPPPPEPEISKRPEPHPQLNLSSSKIAGLSLHETEIHAAFLKQNGSVVNFSHTGTAPAEDALAMTQAIQALWKSKKIPTRTVWANVQKQMMVQKFFALPCEPQELKDALLPEAAEILQIAPEMVALDFHLNDELSPHRELCGMLYALPRWEVEQTLGMLKQAGLYPCGISTTSCDIARLYRQIRVDHSIDQVQGIIHFSEKSADLIFLYGTHSIYTRTIFSKSGVWMDNLSYLVECINDAMMYFEYWVKSLPTRNFLLCGNIPEKEDFCGILLRETGTPMFLWQPFFSGSIVEPAPGGETSSKHMTREIDSIAAALRED